jgi:hypothetical protein
MPGGIPGSRPPVKNGKPDPVWLAVFLIFSTIMASHIIWIVARNGLIVFMGSIIWIIIVLNVKYN